MEKIIIYTNETCGYCKQIKEELTKNKIEFEEKSTGNFLEEWQEVVILTNMPNVPTVFYKNNYFAPSRDYRNVEHLIEILKNFNESNHSIEKQVFEKIKTLTYNVNVAFSRVDQLLKQIETKLNTKENVDKSTD